MEEEAAVAGEKEQLRSTTSLTKQQLLMEPNAKQSADGLTPVLEDDGKPSVTKNNDSAATAAEEGPPSTPEAVEEMSRFGANVNDGMEEAEPLTMSARAVAASAATPSSILKRRKRHNNDTEKEQSPQQRDTKYTKTAKTETATTISSITVEQINATAQKLFENDETKVLYRVRTTCTLCNTCLCCFSTCIIINDSSDFYVSFLVTHNNLLSFK